ncbi:MAG: cupin domain-containing protein [Pseudomonadota bacterium]
MTTETWGTMTWLMEDAIEPGAGLSLARMTVKAGHTSPAHHHPNCTETIHVLAGEIEERIGEGWITASTGDTVLIPIDSVHQTRNVGEDDAVLIVAYSAGARIYQEVDS